jgi:hypothetical protein
MLRGGSPARSVMAFSLNKQSIFSISLLNPDPQTTLGLATDQRAGCMTTQDGDRESNKGRKIVFLPIESRCVVCAVRAGCFVFRQYKSSSMLLSFSSVYTTHVDRLPSLLNSPPVRLNSRSPSFICVLTLEPSISTNNI